MVPSRIPLLIVPSSSVEISETFGKKSASQNLAVLQGKMSVVQDVENPVFEMRALNIQEKR